MQVKFEIQTALTWFVMDVTLDNLTFYKSVNCYARNTPMYLLMCDTLSKQKTSCKDKSPTYIIYCVVFK
jgi:hypothetical protein